VLIGLPTAPPRATAQKSSSLFNLVEEVVADAAVIALNELRAPTRRSAQVARARQYVMYLAHTALGLSVTAIARGCGRHHSTVAHACRVIEERRDDSAVDRTLTTLEQALRVRCGELGIRLEVE
jgi:chromosomal replication initiation ATPase DnaA